jgi:regulator of protease activity HflC (stomatin/prohibitin superfamily)
MLVLAVLTVGCTRVSPGYVGIKIVNGGSDRGVQDYPIQVGWVFYNPFTSSVFEYPTFTQTAVWTKSAAEGNPANEEITFTNKDQMLVAADINLSYSLQKEKVPAFYVKFRSDNVNHFTHGYLRNLARDIFNEHAGQYSISEIMGDNAKFLKEVRDSLQAQVAQYGISIDQFGIIGAPRPPAVVIESINAKVHATQLAIKTENELRTATAEAQKQIATAKGQAESAIAAAQGEAESIRIRAEAQSKANELLNKSLTGNLLELKRLEMWDGQLPQVQGSVNPFITLERRQQQN